MPATISVVPMARLVLTGSGFAIRLTTVGICPMKLIALQVSKVHLMAQPLLSSQSQVSITETFIGVILLS